jgi:hemerythrin-like domain-containing protein
MSHDAFENERFRVERVLEILEHATRRLDAHAPVPLPLLRDAVRFISTSEASAYEAAQLDDSEPALSACLEQHAAAKRPLSAMTDALRALERGDAGAAARFARSTREYIELRREHLRIDDRLFARAPRHGSSRDEQMQFESVDGPETRRLYDRLVESAAILDIGVSTAYPPQLHRS